MGTGGGIGRCGLRVRDEGEWVGEGGVFDGDSFWRVQQFGRVDASFMM